MIYIFIAVGIFILDRRLKEYVNSRRLQGTKQEILNGKVILRNCHNDGRVLGRFPVKNEKIRESSAMVLGAVVWEFVHQCVTGACWLGKLGLAMVFGGGYNNYREREEKGFVTDYVSLGAKNPKIKKIAFNLSDLFIAGGTFLWLVSVLKPQRKK